MLDKKQKYLQVALNSDLSEARNIIAGLPSDKRIIIEAGTPLIKAYGADGIRAVKSYWQSHILGMGVLPSAPFLPFTGAMGGQKFAGREVLEMMFKTSGRMYAPHQLRRLSKIKKAKDNQDDFILNPYIVADMKCMDRGKREVEIAKQGGASSVVALGHAPLETLDAFIENCQAAGLDAMIDMMNVEFPLSVLRKLKQLPQVVILHRGVDEEEFNKEKAIPYHEIARIKNECDIMIAVAGGDTFEEVRRALFNDADIAVVWKSFYSSSINTSEIAEKFLKEIR